MSKTEHDLTTDRLEQLPSVMYFGWTEKARVADFSQAALDLFGIEEPPTVDGLLKFVHPEDRLRVEAETTAFLEVGGAHSHQYRILRPDGDVRHVFSHVDVSCNDVDGSVEVQGLFIDVTKERQRSNPLPNSTTRRFGFYEFDVQNGTSLWTPELRRTLLANPTAAVTFDTVYKSLHPDDRDAVTKKRDAILKQPSPFELTFRIVLPTGETIWLRDKGEARGPIDPNTGQVDRITGTLSDVSNEITQLTDVQSGQDAFWALIDTAPFGVYAVDADFRIARMSEGGKPTFQGIDPLIGRDLGEVLHILWSDPFASEAIDHFRHTLATGESYRAVPLVEQRADRKVIESYDWGIDRMRLADGRLGVICHFYDLTERELYQQELEERERRLNLAYDVADMGAWEVDLETGKTTLSPQLYRLLGGSPETETPEDVWLRVVHPEDAKIVNAAFEAASTGSAPVNVDVRIMMPDGEVRYLTVRGEAVMSADGTPEKIIGVNYDNTTEIMAQHALASAERRLRNVIDNAVAFIGVLDLDGTLREANALALRAGGVERGDVIGHKFWETYWWTHDDDVAQQLKESHAAALTGATVHYDTVARMAGGELMSIEFMLSPVLDDKGEVTMLVASGFDISEREQQREQIQALMGEINHRSKNILTLVQIIARQTARSGGDDFIERFETRIMALARAQDLLLKGSAGDKVNLRALALSQMGHFEDLVDTRISLTGPQILVGPSAARAIGMALHELATNAGKYGALSNETGTIDVVWLVDSTGGSGPMFKIEWRETGGPSVVKPDREGFGSSVIQSLIASSLNGEVDLDYAECGVKWTFRCAFDALDDGVGAR